MIDRRAMLDFVNELEEKFCVDRWRTEDFHIWPLLRERLFYLFSYPGISLRFAVSRAVRAEWDRLTRRTSRRLPRLRTDATLTDSLRIPADVLFLSSVHHRSLLNGRWFNRHVDPLLDYLNQIEVPALLLELKTGVDHRHPVFHPEQCINIESHLKTYVDENVDKAKFSLLEPGEDEYQSFLAYIAVRTRDRKRALGSLGLERIRYQAALRALSLERIKYQIRMLQVSVGFFRSLLVESRSRVCFVVVYNAPVAKALCIACFQLGIVSIDLQHGVQGVPAYSRWRRLPERGYEMLPAQFWCWSAQEKRVIDDWAGRSGQAHQAVVAGYPWLDMWLEGGHLATRDSFAEVESLMTAGGSDVNILYTLQPIEGLGIRLPEAVIQAIKGSPPHWKWWIRVHPGMVHETRRCQRRLARKCATSKFDVEHATSLPLPALLKYMHVHVTHWSSTVLEAATCGVPSILLHPQGQSLFAEQMRMGSATFWDFGHGSLVHCIADMLSRPCQPAIQRVNWKKVVDQLLASTLSSGRERLY